MIATVSTILGILGFGISLYKDIDNLTPQLEKAYNNALSKWTRNEGVREYYAKRYYPSLSSLKEFITNRRESVSRDTAELIKLFYNEIKSYETAEGFEIKALIGANIQISQETLSNTYEIISDVKETRKNVDFLVDQCKCNTTIQKIEYAQPDDYIERSVRNYSEYSFDTYLHPERYSSQELCNYIIDGVNSIILFSDAQLGKTTELKALAYKLQYSDLYSPYIFEVCNYLTSRSLESQIERYIDLSVSNSVLILDGLDEANSNDRSLLVKEVNQLRNNYPNLYIIISCRLNFKDLVALSSFSILYLDELGWNEAKRYINKCCKDPAGLIEALEHNHYYEMTRSPFLLIETIKYYEEDGVLPSNVTAIYSRFIDRCFDVDRTKIQDIVSPKARLYAVLKRIAFCLVVSQRVHITSDELYEDLNISSEDIELCLKLSIINKGEEGLKFIHNSFKEFMTAESLSVLSFEKLQTTICYKDSIKIRPSMYNTIILLLGVIDTSSRIYEPLKAWLICDYKELLVNAGGEFLNENQKDNIFEEVYNDHKRKGLWLEYDYARSLMLFANTRNSIKFMLSEISSVKEPDVYLYNALSLLHYANFSLLNQSEFSDAHRLLLRTLDKYKSDRNICDQTIKPIENITFVNYDKEIISEVHRIVKDTEYHNLISMFCTIVSSCDLCDEYANWVFEKSGYVCNYYENGISHTISNSDLIKFFTKLKDAENIVKAAEYILTTTEHMFFEEENTATIFKNLKRHNKDNVGIYNQIVNFVCTKEQRELTSKYIDSYRGYIADNYDLSTLFSDCYTDIKHLFTSRQDYTKEQQQVILNKFTLLVTAQGIDFIIADNDIDEQRKLFILNYLISESMIIPNDAQAKTLNYIEQYDQERIDRRVKEQESFDLLFDIEELRNQVKEAISGLSTINLRPWQERVKFMHSCKNKTISDFIDLCSDAKKETAKVTDIIRRLSDDNYCLRFSLSHIPLQNSYIKVGANISQEQRKKLENMVLWGFENVDMVQGCTRLSQLIIDYNLNIPDDVILSLLPFSWQHIAYHTSSKNSFSNSVYIFEWIVDVVKDKSKLNAAIEELILSNKITREEHFLQIAEYILRGKHRIMFKYIDNLANNAGHYKLNVIQEVLNLGHEGTCLIEQTLNQLDDNEKLYYYIYLLFPEKALFITSTEQEDIKAELELEFEHSSNANYKYRILDVLLRIGSCKALEWGLFKDAIENHWKISTSFPPLSRYDSSHIDFITRYLETGTQIDHSYRDSSNMFDSAKTTLQMYAKESAVLRDQVVETFRNIATYSGYNYIHRVADATFDSYFENQLGDISLRIASELYSTIIPSNS